MINDLPQIPSLTMVDWQIHVKIIIFFSEVPGTKKSQGIKRKITTGVSKNQRELAIQFRIMTSSYSILSRGQ